MNREELVSLSSENKKQLDFLRHKDEKIVLQKD
jgi:hypothetical protein